MILGDLTWPEVEKLDREIVVLIPTGSLEQHGPHLPLLTDTLISTAVTSEVERCLPKKTLQLPTIWLGASRHHLGFPGTVTASTSGYLEALRAAIDSLASRGFRRFYIVNGHGGNESLNDVALRDLKADKPTLMLGASLYARFGADEIASVLEGPAKNIRHACEAETSLMLHLYPDKVHMDRAIDDGMAPNPPVKGLQYTFDEITERGVLGYATLATAEKGKRIFDACVKGLCLEIEAFSGPVALEG